MENLKPCNKYLSLPEKPIYFRVSPLHLLLPSRQNECMHFELQRLQFDVSKLHKLSFGTDFDALKIENWCSPLLPSVCDLRLGGLWSVSVAGLSSPDHSLFPQPVFEPLNLSISVFELEHKIRRTTDFGSSKGCEMISRVLLLTFLK